MDQHRFDALTRSLAVAKTRRGLLGGIAALAVGVRAASAQSDCPISGQTRNAKGKCACPAGTDPCPDGCVDLKRSTAACGTCGQSCEGGTCRRGTCVCPDGASPDPTFGCPRPIVETCTGQDRCDFFQGDIVRCNQSNRDCLCTVSLGGVQYCGAHDIPCTDLTPCSADAECPSGSYCTGFGCCGTIYGRGVCIAECPA